MDKLPSKTTKGEAIPEPTRPEILMEKTEIKYIDENMIWACKNCDFKCNTYRGMVGHMANKHRLITIHENNRIRCPFCLSFYNSYATLKEHMFFKNGCNPYIDIQSSRNPLTGPEIWRKIKETNDPQHEEQATP